MKISILTVLVFLFSNVFSQNIKIEKIPTNIEEFVELRNLTATTPEGGAAMFLLAMKIYDDNAELGKKCFVVAVDQGSLTEGDTYKGFSLLKSDLQLIESQLAKDINIPNSYIKSSSVNNSYKVTLPYEYEFSRNSYSGTDKEGAVKVFVKCSGADSARPMSLKINDKGLWKVTVWSSVLVGIKKVPVSDDL
jgi:hypothetical protein